MKDKNSNGFLSAVPFVFFLAISLLGCAGENKKLTKAEISSLVPSGQVENGVRIIKVKAVMYEFTPNPIVVKSGEQVQLEVTSQDTTHGINIPAYKIDCRLEPGKTEVITFKAQEEGRIPFRCSVFCGTGHFGMHGDLVVLPADQ